MNQAGPVAILGATSALAQDFVVERSKHMSDAMWLYARRPEAVAAFLALNGLSGRHVVRALADFNGTQRHSGIVNFIGVGDPARAKAMGAGIFEATLTADNLVLGYLAEHPATRYVFLSSGAVYGGEFNTPADEASPAIFPVNALRSQDFYGLAKLHAEGRHRGQSDRTIIDVRIFNYVSRHMDLGSRFLLVDMINAVRNRTVFRTDDRDIVRDFLHPSDLRQLIEAALNVPEGANIAVDAYSMAPVSKLDLIRFFQERYGMHTEIVETVNAINATGLKGEYYSVNRRAETIGYYPKFSSIDGIAEEIRFIARL